MSNAQGDAQGLADLLGYPVQSVIAAADDAGRVHGLTWERVLGEAFCCLVLGAERVDEAAVQTWKTLAAKYAGGQD